MSFADDDGEGVAALHLSVALRMPGTLTHRRKKILVSAGADPGPIAHGGCFL